MAEIDFNFKNSRTRIQCEINDTLKEISKKFAAKLEVDVNSLFFIYDGKKINEDLTFYNLANTLDKERKKISILVFEDDNTIDDKKNIIKIKQVVCPECKENTRLKFEDYKITLFKCKNNHIINNILLKDYDATQDIDQSKIKCEFCKRKW